MRNYKKTFKNFLKITLFLSLFSSCFENSNTNFFPEISYNSNCIPTLKQNKYETNSILKDISSSDSLLEFLFITGFASQSESQSNPFCKQIFSKYFYFYNSFLSNLIECFIAFSSNCYYQFSPRAPPSHNT
jgi:hypothetical protein